MFFATIVLFFYAIPLIWCLDTIRVDLFKGSYYLYQVVITHIVAFVPILNLFYLVAYLEGMKKADYETYKRYTMFKFLFKEIHYEEKI